MFDYFWACSANAWRRTIFRMIWERRTGADQPLNIEFSKDDVGPGEDAEATIWPRCAIQPLLPSSPMQSDLDFGMKELVGIFKENATGKTSWGIRLSLWKYGWKGILNAKAELRENASRDGYGSARKDSVWCSDSFAGGRSGFVTITFPCWHRGEGGVVIRSFRYHLVTDLAHHRGSREGMVEDQ
jgi:hypothetical protein